MPKVRMPDGSTLDVGLDALFADDGATPLNVPTGPTFTAQDLERVRSEEKDKLYGRIETLTQEITGFREQVGSLTAAEQRRVAQAEEERARLEAEAQRQQEQGMDPQALIEKARQEWQTQLHTTQQQWEQQLQAERQQREQAEAVAAKEREFTNLREYTLNAVDQNKDKIAPQLLPWIQGNSQEEVDAAVARAIATTDEITAEMQQVISQQQTQQPFPGVQTPGVPPALPGTRVTGGPITDPAGEVNQTLTPEQIANMDMASYAQLRNRLNIGGQSNNRGLFG